MKIAMMTNNYKPFVAGVPVSVERLTQGLREQGHQVVVFAPSYDGQQEERDVVRYRSFLRGLAGGVSIPNSLDPEIERKFREGDFDLIHVHHPMMIGDTARYLSWKYHVPLVFTYHTRYEQYLHYVGLSALKRAMPAYVRHCTRRCDMVIAPTPLMKEHLEGLRLSSQVAVLPTGLKGDSFHPEEEKSMSIRKALLGGRKYLFCTVARLAKEKNLEFLLRSLKMRKDACGGDFKLALVGEGPHRQAIERLAGELGLWEEVVFVGEVPNGEVKNYCHGADLFLFPSLSETQGIVLLESMAAGTPVVALRATGTQDVVVNGRNGYMTEASEIEFERKIMDILEKKELDFLRQGARQTALLYGSEGIARQAALVYARAIQLRREKESQRHNHRNRAGNVVYS